MSGSVPRLLRRIAPSAVCALAVAVWPFLFLYRYAVPGTSQSLRIGNDFPYLYYAYAHHLLDALAGLELPGWSPSEAAGYPFWANPFAASCYPPFWLLAPAYELLGGWSLYLHRLYTIGGLALLGVGLFAWLRETGQRRRVALLAALLLTISWRPTELVRFPNAMHAAAWLPWVLCGLTRTLRRPGWGGPTLLALSTLCLVTAGYPYYAFYAPFLCLPWAALLLWRPTRCALLDASAGEPPAWGRSVARVGGAVAAAALLCSPWLLAVRDLLGQTVDRAGGSLAFSDQLAFSPQDTLGSLVYPPAASPEGWYYVGLTPLLLIAVHVARALGGWRTRRRDAIGAAVILSAWILISLVSYGARSPLFLAAWHLVPGFSQLRAWSRFNVLLVPLLALLLARSIQDWARWSQAGERRPLLLLAVATLTVLLAQLGLRALPPHAYWSTWDFERLTNPSRFLWITVVAAGALGLTGWRAAQRRTPPGLTSVGLLLALTWVDLAPVGARQWSEPARVDPPRFRLQRDERARRSLAVPRQEDKAWTISLTTRFNVSLIPNWYLQRYVDFLEQARDREPQALAWLLGIEDGRRLFLSVLRPQGDLAPFRADVERLERAGTARAEVERYDGDLLRLRVELDRPGYLTFVDNDYPGWGAEVDGVPTPIERAFGTFKAVPLAPGRHAVEFRFSPWRSLLERP